MSKRRRISAKECAEIFTRAEGRCHICGLKIDAGRERWEVEHVIPLQMGGDEERGSTNLQPAHVACHRDKTRQDVGHIAKSKRQRQRDSGIKRGGLKDKPPWIVRPPTKQYPRGYLVHRETGEVRAKR